MLQESPHLRTGCWDCHRVGVSGGGSGSYLAILRYLPTAEGVDE